MFEILDFWNHNSKKFRVLKSENKVYLCNVIKGVERVKSFETPNEVNLKQMKDKVTYWTELSDYDFDTAVAMLETGRYLYVGFMCHQSIEKILKAYFNSVNDEPAPFTHSLTHLAKKTNLYEQLSDELIDFLDILEPLNIEARYPSFKEKLMKSLTKERCVFILENTKTLKSWIIAKF